VPVYASGAQVSLTHSPDLVVPVVSVVFGVLVD
jgi:hypothetical protein